MHLPSLFGTRTRITTQPDQMTTMSIKFGGSAIGRNADNASLKKNGRVSTSVTGVAVSPIAGEVVLKANGHIKRVRDAVKCERSIF